jgi:hypothetical protein
MLKKPNSYSNSRGEICNNTHIQNICMRDHNHDARGWKGHQEGLQIATARLDPITSYHRSGANQGREWIVVAGLPRLW